MDEKELSLDEIRTYALVSEPDEMDTYQFAAALDPFRQDIFLQAMRDRLDAEGGTFTAKSFDRRWAAFKKSQRAAKPKKREGDAVDLPVEIDLGKWELNSSGISCMGDIACGIPILPTKLMTDIETGEEKMTLSYFRGGQWMEKTIDNDIVSSKSKATRLMSWGIPVTSENAQTFVRYITEVYTLNIDRFVHVKCVSRCGWHGAEYGFAPWSNSLVFDDDANEMAHSISAAGSRDKSVEALRKAALSSVQARLVIAASLASILVKPMNRLPFVCHLWSTKSGNGKTVCLMAAASLWGKPDVGEYIRTFDATAVGLERTLGFLNHLPLCVDELQITRDSQGKNTVNLYRLTEGSGRSRGNIAGGVDRLITWRNSIVSTGETPITSSTSAAGEFNRVIDIEVPQDGVLLDDPRGIADAVRSNYGFIGREIVAALYTDPEKMRAMFQHHMNALDNLGATGKQADAMALILTADAILAPTVYGCAGLTAKDVFPFVKTDADVSAGQRGLDFLAGWIAANQMHFVHERQHENGVYYPDNIVGNTEVYGRIFTGNGRNETAIIKTVFDRVCSENGVQPSGMLAWLKSHDCLLTESERRTRRENIGGSHPRCVVIKESALSSD